MAQNKFPVDGFGASDVLEEKRGRVLVWSLLQLFVCIC